MNPLSSISRTLCAGVIALSFFVGCSHTTEVVEPVLSDKFSDIQTRLLNKSCAYAGCHGGDNPKALLSLDSNNSYNSLINSIVQNTAASKRYRALVVPGKPDSSFLYWKVAGPKSDEGSQMPERLNPIPQNEINAIKSWISRGAPND